MAIAFTYRKQPQEQQQNGAQNGTQSSGTKQNTNNNTQTAYKPQETNAQQQQNQQQPMYLQRPQTYNSKYSDALEGIMQQIQNPGQFKYEFNADNLFKYYADLYSQNGKQAAMDVMGQAAGLTGGYGNTYGQQVAQQQYQEYMRPLYEVGMNMYDRAYQQDQDELANQKDAYNMLLNMDANDYNRYRDTVGDWQADRDLAANYALAILQNGSMPSEELLQAAGLSPEDAAKLIAQLQGGGGGSGKDPVKLLQDALGKAALGSANGLLQGAIPGAAALAAAGNILPESLQGFANGWAGAENIPDRNRTVDVVKERQYMPGTTSKEKTTTMTQQQYDRMIEEQLKKEMQRKK